MGRGAGREGTGRQEGELSVSEPGASEPGGSDVAERLARLEERDQRLIAALGQLAGGAGAPPRKRRRDWDGLAAVIASLVGVLALAIAGYTAYVQRQQLRAQVWPNVLLEYSGINMTFFARSQGTGPARITAVRMAVNGVVVRRWAELSKAAEFNGDAGFASSDLGATVLSPDKEFVFLQPRNDASRAAFRELFPGGKHRLVVTLCYCSVLEDCWVSSSTSAPDDEPGTRDDCPISAAERFVGG